MSSEKQFYKDARLYWEKVPPTVNGVLGGYGHISDVDLEGSQAFLRQILSQASPPRTRAALDCGAGIGRITKNILIHHFDNVDLVEQDEKFINFAVQSIGTDNKKLGAVYRIGLQHFHPDKKYDVIWIQWVLGHLNDDDLCAFLKRCGQALHKNGVIIVKENVTDDHEMDYDEVDSSVTRPCELFLKIFDTADLMVIKNEVQQGFPEDLYTVHMFALISKPVQDDDEED